MENDNHSPAEAHSQKVDLNDLFDQVQSQRNPTVSCEKTRDNNLQKLFRVSEELRTRKSGEIVFQQPIIQLGKTGIVFPNTITLIQGPAGAHKSRLAQGLCSLILCEKEMNFLNFESNLKRPINLSYLDTERNVKDQFPYALQQIQRNAGFRRQEHPYNFYYSSLISIPRDERLECLEAYVQQLCNEKNGHFVLVLDVITDVIADFNKVDGSLSCLDWMNRLINEYGISFIAIIHENPNSEKARGHMGTELMNKVTTAIQIAPESSCEGSGIFKVRFLKARNSALPRTFYVRYDETLKNLAVVPEEEVLEGKSKKLQASPQEIIPLLGEWLKAGKMSSKDLLSRLQESFGTSDKIIRQRLSTIIQSNMVVLGAGNDRLFLNKEQPGKEVFYFLQ